jgi:hypothetical protein
MSGGSTHEGREPCPGRVRILSALPARERGVGSPAIAAAAAAATAATATVTTATAAATAASAAASTAAEATTTTTATTAAATAAFLSLVHTERAPIERRAVELGDRGLGLSSIAHGDEAEATRAAGVPVRHDVNVDDLSALGKGLAEGIDSGVEREVTDVQTLTHDPFLFVAADSNSVRLYSKKGCQPRRGAADAPLMGAVSTSTLASPERLRRAARPEGRAVGSFAGNVARDRTNLSGSYQGARRKLDRE